MVGLNIVIFLNVVSFFLFNDKKQMRYRNFYRPWLLLFLSLILFIVYTDMEASFLEKFSSSYDAEVFFAFYIVLSWIFFKLMFKLLMFNDKIEWWLKTRSKNELEQNIRGFSNYLVWPYFIHKFDIYTRPGYKLFKVLFWVMGIILLFAYYWSTRNYYGNLPVIPTALGLVSITIIAEWIIYFSSSFPAATGTVETKTQEEEKEENFYKLFKRYIHPERGFYDSIIFGYSSFGTPAINQEDTNLLLKNINEEFIRRDKDLIISADNFIDIMPGMVDIMLNTLNKGGNILLVADIPNHTGYIPDDVGINYPGNKKVSAARLFAVYLEQTLVHQVPNVQQLLDIGFYSAEDESGFSKKIILCSIEDSLRDNLVHHEWMKNLDLKIVFQFNDDIADSLSTKRRFSLWMGQQEVSYKSLFFKRYSTGGDEALSNTFTSTRDVPEVKIPNVKSAGKSFFINFAFEKSIGNLNKILLGNPNEFDLAPGIELAVFPLMENIRHIHYFEGQHLDLIQSKNKLENLHSKFKTDTIVNGEYNYRSNVSIQSIRKGILNNNLPFIVRPIDKPYCDDKHLSVIHDAENNAPKLYKKYRHLGKDLSFICIVSKPHLFREYFAENMDYFVDVTLEPLEPQLSKSEINLCLQLFLLLSNEKVDIHFVKKLVNAHVKQLNDRSLISYVKLLLGKYLNIDVSKNAILKSASSSVFKDNQYQQLQTLEMDRQSLMNNDIFDYLEKVKVLDKNANLILEIPKYLLFQNYLPQQNLIIDGISYEYVQYNDRKKQLMVNARSTANYTFNKPKVHINTVSGYHQQIDIDESPGIFIDGKLYRFSLLMYEAETEIYYSGCYQFERLYHSPFARTNTPKWIDLTQDEMFLNVSKRKYTTRYLHLKWEVSEKYKAHVTTLTTLVHNLLYEFLPVLFPQRQQYIKIASDNQLYVEHRELIPWVYAENNFEYDRSGNFLELYIVEDAFSDLGTLKAIQSIFQKILKDLYFFLQWLQDEKSYTPNHYSEYISGKTYFQDKLHFLKYGIDDNRIQWDIPLLIEFLEESGWIDVNAIGNGYRHEGLNVNSVHDVECDYCAQSFKLKDVHIMEDGLQRCESCSDDAVDDLKLAKELELKAHELYREHLDIDFSTIPYEFNFVTATEMHRSQNKDFFVTNNFDKREYAGLTSDREIDQIFIEKFLKRSATLSVIIHELMHVYQFYMLNYFKLKNVESQMIEGMATYAEVFLMRKSNIPEYMAYADSYEARREKDSSEYGIGFRYVKKKYGARFVKRAKNRYRGKWIYISLFRLGLP